jgi:TolB protein
LSINHRRRINPRIVLIFCLVSLVVAPVATRAQMDVWPEPIVQENVFQIPLWMGVFITESAELTSATQRIERVLFQDLEFSGIFQIVRQVPTAVGLKDDISVQVHGKVFVADDQPYFEGWVTDVSSGDFLGGKKYKLPAKGERKIAHHFADEVVRLVSGEKGIATTRIVFVRKRENQWELVLSDYDGYNPRVLVRQGVPLLNPRWADSNGAIIYTTYRGGKADLYIRYITESKSTPVATHKGINYVADWSDRQQMILAALSKDGNSELYLLQKSGAIKRRLTHNRAIDTSPCWSPGGRELVFVSDRSGRPQLYIMERDGGNVRRLTFTGGYNATPAWGPQGDLIAFVSRIGNDFQIATITADGREGRLVTTDGKSHEDPRWAPNGRHIVYTERAGSNEVISVVDRVTGGRRILAQGANPDWSSK